MHFGVSSEDCTKLEQVLFDSAPLEERLLSHLQSLGEVTVPQKELSSLHLPLPFFILPVGA